jgi:hypothetical protein
VFEKICTQYLIRLARQRRLPFIPHTIGRWWGSNPKTRKEDDIDILALDARRESAIFCECTYRHKPFGMDEYKDFFNATTILTGPVKRYYYLFSKSGFAATVRTQAQHDGVVLVGLDELFMV